MKKFLKFRIVALLLMCGTHTLAITGGRSGVTQLEQAGSTAAMSMGGAGITDDIGQMYYNPSFLYNPITGRNFSFSYNTMGTEFNENYAFLGYAWPGESAKFALSVSYQGNTGLDSYDTSGNFTESYSTAEFLTGFAHIWRLSPSVTVGETLKLYYLNYSFAGTSMVSADFGLNWEVLPFLNLGFSMDNLLSTNMTLATESESLPVIMRFQPTVEFLKKKARIFYQLDYYAPLYEDYNDPLEHRVGLEFDLYKKYVQARAGYDGQNFGLGVGSFVKPYRISVGYLPTPVETRYSMTFSFDLDASGVGPFARPKHAAKSDVEAELVDFYEGMQNYNKGEYKNAYDKFTNVLKINPQHELAKDYQARALLHLQTSEAWLDDEQLKLIRLHKELARKYESKENYGDAINEWRQVLAINPADIEGEPNIARIKEKVDLRVQQYHRQGLTSYAANDRIKAIEYFNAALKLNPEFVPSKNWLFKIKQEVSQEELRKIEEIERLQKAEVFYNRGLTYLGEKEYERAIQAFQEALTMNPNHENAKKYLKLAAEDWELDKKGLRGLKAAEQLFAKGKKNYDEEKYYYALKDFRASLRALPSYREALEYEPRAEKKLEAQTRPYLLDGKAAFRDKKYSVAEKKFGQVLLFDPDNEEARDYMKKIGEGKAAVIEYHMVEGRKDLSKAGKSGTTSDYSDAIRHFNEVLKLATEGSAEYTEAGSSLRKAQLQVKAKTEKLHQEALKLFEAQQYDDAIDKWRAVLEIDDANIAAAKYIEQAEEAKTKKMSSKTIQGLMVKGQALYQNREYEKALDAFNQILGFNKTHKEALKYKKLCETELENEKKQDQVAKLFIEGVRAYKSREYDEAIKAWKKIAKLDPENTLVEKYIERARQAKKDRKRIDYIAGKGHFDAGRWLQARASLQRALKEDPGNSDARKLLASTEENIEIDRQRFVQDGDREFRDAKYDEAAALYTRALQLSVSTEITEKRDNALQAKAKKEEGLKYFKSENDVGLSIDPFLSVLELNPFDKEASRLIQEAKAKGKTKINDWLEQAAEAEKNKDYKKAFSLYKSVREIDPANNEARRGIKDTRTELRKLAAGPYREGQEAMALKNYTLAIDKFKETNDLLADYENTQALLKQARELKAEAIRKNRSSGGKTTEASESDLAAMNQGIKLYRQGKYSQAISTWSKIPKSSSAYSKAQKYIARAKLKL